MPFGDRTPEMHPWRTECEAAKTPRNGRRPQARVLLIAASILAARKLAQIDRPCPALDFCIADSIAKAEKIIRKIDPQCPRKGPWARDFNVLPLLNFSTSADLFSIIPG
jgi:hypothetical protein